MSNMDRLVYPVDPVSDEINDASCDATSRPCNTTPSSIEYSNEAAFMFDDRTKH